MDYNELYRQLKTEAQNIDIDEFIDLSNYFQKEVKYLPSSYKYNYIENIQKIVIKRLLSLRNENENYTGILSKKELETVNNLLSKKDNKIEYLLNIVAVYTIVLLKKPIHYNAFPNDMNVYKKHDNYYCYVKKNHLKDKDSLCKYCIAKPVEDDKDAF